MVEEALRQHVLFGGQAIDSRGRLVQAGFSEAEFDRPQGETVPTWRRVHDFWEELGDAAPRQVRGSVASVVPLAPLQRRLRAFAVTASDGGDSGRGSPGAATTAAQAMATESAVLRAAVVDNPWSAVFISHLAYGAGVPATAFLRSDAHADYVDQALRTSDEERAPGSPDAPDTLYRACDLATTTPRAGDLVCHTRDRAAQADRFDRVAQALALRRARGGGAFAMHCEIVVAVDRAAAKLDAVGGNVLQSVTRRRMNLNTEAQPTLAAGYFASRQPEHCRRRAIPCQTPGFNFQPWSVLLQSRG